jgi:predicted nucleic acid-binding protein
LIAAHRLSTGLSLPDFLIAAQAIHHSTTLFTFNLKHFAAIPGLDAKAP